MALPQYDNYGTVTGQFLVSAPNSSDSPATGTVVFKPSSGYLLNHHKDNPFVALDVVQTATLDAEGFLVDPDTGERGFRLIPTNDPLINPTGWTYEVTLDLKDAEGNRVRTAPRIYFELGMNETKDIVDIIPGKRANGTYVSKGEKGDANQLSIGTVSFATEASATITGDAPRQILNLALPRGEKGDKGDKGNVGADSTVAGPVGPTGATPKLKVGEVRTATNVKDAEWLSDIILDGQNLVTEALAETFPSTMKGDRGATGAKGTTGDRGITGLTPNMKIGEINTQANPADEDWIADIIRGSATVTDALSDTFPSTMKGEKGNKGDTGISGFVPVIIAPPTDPDTLVTPGIYRIAGAGTAHPNWPRGAGILTVNARLLAAEQYGPSVVQEFSGVFGAVASESQAFQKRTLTGATWSPWRVFTSQRVDNTAGRAIYTWDDTASREQLIYGDTGWRRIPVAAPSMIADTFMSIRRVGGTVTIAVFRSQIVAPNSGDFVTIPNGFRTGITLQTPVAIGDSSVAPCQITSTADNNLRLWWSAPSGWLSFTISYPTNDAWPTSLPGTAVGSIPTS